MRVLSTPALSSFSKKHPETQASLTRWLTITKAAKWATMAEVQTNFSTAKVLNADRVRFEVAGGNYRMIVAFDLQRQIAFVKFIGTHKDYDKINPLTVSQF